MGWTSPAVFGLLTGGSLLMALFPLRRPEAAAVEDRLPAIATAGQDRYRQLLCPVYAEWISVGSIKCPYCHSGTHRV